MLNYNKNNVALARVLRKNMTPQERKLWYDFLRNYEIRFQRQKPIGNYIADFYCHKARLIIELDGSGHYFDKQEKRDKPRTEELESLGLRVIRFSNLDVDNNFDGVCTYVDNMVRDLMKEKLPQSR